MTHGVLPGSVPGPLFALALTVLVMLPTALWITSVTEGRPGVRALLARAVQWRFSPGWWLVVLLALPVLTVAVGAALGRDVGTSGLGGLLVDELLALVIAVVVINLWEETVWAGFLQTRLRARSGFWPAAVLTAVAFAGIHVPLQFVGPVTAASVASGVGALLVLGLLVRVMVGVVLTATGGSVLAVAVLHALFNATTAEGDLADRLLSGAAPLPFAVTAVVLVTAAAAAALRTGRRQAP
jgi:membrane protease YdiL (CAAX protease family)